jgi:hypothetical protein
MTYKVDIRSGSTGAWFVTVRRDEKLITNEYGECALTRWRATRLMKGIIKRDKRYLKALKKVEAIEM